MCQSTVGASVLNILHYLDSAFATVMCFQTFCRNRVSNARVVDPHKTGDYSKRSNLPSVSKNNMYLPPEYA